jgi:hypothetical protein
MDSKDFPVVDWRHGGLLLGDVPVVAMGVHGMTEPIKAGDSVKPRTGRYAEHEGIVARVFQTDDAAHPYPIVLANVCYPGLDGRIGTHDTRYLIVTKKGTGQYRRNP